MMKMEIRYFCEFLLSEIIFASDSFELIHLFMYVLYSRTSMSRTHLEP